MHSIAASVTMLYSRNWRNTGNLLYLNKNKIKFKKKKKKRLMDSQRSSSTVQFFSVTASPTRESCSPLLTVRMTSLNAASGISSSWEHLFTRHHIGTGGKKKKRNWYMKNGPLHKRLNSDITWNIKILVYSNWQNFCYSIFSTLITGQIIFMKNKGAFPLR